MSFLKELFSNKKSQTPGMEQNPQAGAAPIETLPHAGFPLRLADPHHPARQQIEAIASLIDANLQIGVKGDRPLITGQFPLDVVEQIMGLLEQAENRWTEDLDLRITRASFLYILGRTELASGILDDILVRHPAHYEARPWKNHFEAWHHVLRCPPWSLEATSLHPVMLGYLRHEMPLQLVRDGLQKTVAVVTEMRGPPFSAPPQCQIAWMISHTPYGPLLAYYVSVTEKGEPPNVMEAFVPIFQPSVHNAHEGRDIYAQLVATPYCFLVIAGETSLLLNQRMLFGPKTRQNLESSLAELYSSGKYLPQEKYEAARQWHMNNFNIEKVEYEEPI